MRNRPWNLGIENEASRRVPVPPYDSSFLGKRVEGRIDFGSWKNSRIVFEFALGCRWIEDSDPFLI